MPRMNEFHEYCGGQEHVRPCLFSLALFVTFGNSCYSVLVRLILNINNLGYMSQIRKANSLGDKPGIAKP